MKRALRWIRNGLLALLVLAVIAAAGIYALSEYVMRRTHDAPAASVALPAGIAALAEGERLARIRGCFGCHGKQLQGKMFVDDPMLAYVSAPNLTRSVERHSDAELARIIRHGVRPDGRSVAIMPSSMYLALTDDDLGRILAYLRSAPKTDGVDRVVRLGPLGRLGVAIGQFPLEVEMVQRAAALADTYPAGNDTHALGAYLARTVCTECHGLALEGGDDTPALAIALAYSLEDFTRLMRTGVALGDRELGLMTQVARSRFSHFTDAEIAALHAFLVARAGPAAAAGP